MPWPRLRLLDVEEDVAVTEDDPSEEALEDALDTSEELVELSDELDTDDDSSANAGIAESASAAIREQDAILRMVFGEGNRCTLLLMARVSYRLPFLQVRE